MLSKIKDGAVITKGVDKGINKFDFLIAFMVGFFVLIFAFLGLDEGHHWGDDFAAYLSEGISIAEGTFEEQVEMNTILHPSKTVRTESDEKLVYSWGYPLMLSVVYKFCGYNFENTHLLIYYKLPNVICFAILSATLYLFYKHRFSSCISLILSMIFCMNSNVLTSVNSIQTDIPELCCCMVALLLIDYFITATKGKSRMIVGILIGVFLWLCYVIRLNGFTMYLVFMLAQFCNRKQVSEKKRLFVALLPHILFLVMVFASNNIFAPATSNMEDVGKITFGTLWRNILYYNTITENWITVMFPFGGHIFWKYISKIVLLFVFIGILCYTKKENIHLFILLVGTYMILYMLNYTQGLRYLFNALPIFLMYAAYGMQQVVQWLIKIFPWLKRYFLAFAVFALVVIAGNAILTSVLYASEDKSERPAVTDGAYSVEAIDIYSYITNNTNEDAIIAFEKSRVLYLSTGRMSLFPFGERFEEFGADYLLVFKPESEQTENEITLMTNQYVKAGDYIEEYSNDKFVLYRKQEDGS